MIALLLVAQVAAAGQFGAPAQRSVAPPAFAAGLPAFTMRQVPRMRCSDARTIQTDLEPALLFRPQDRQSTHLRKLGDLPPAKACLAGADQ